MKGIQYITDESGRKTAVIVSLREWGHLWEDIHDILVSEARRDEPAVPWEELKRELREADRATDVSD